MFIGTDIDAFFEVDMTEDYPHYFWPVHVSSEYKVPFDELPESTQMLFDYNPELAIEMLEAEGYPFGTLKIDVFTTGGSPQEQDRSAFLQSEWAKIGVEVTLDFTTTGPDHIARLRDGDWEDVYYVNQGGQVDAQTQMQNERPGAPASGENYEMYWYDTPNADAIYAMQDELKFVPASDFEEIARMVRQLTLWFYEDVVFIPTGGPRAIAIAYWPWMKNYYGELSAGQNRNYYESLGRTWIDQELKAEMGY
jgi:peptide/nickel transport system substrate-binding protein